MSQLTRAARDRHAAVVAFTCYDLETANGVLEAAEQTGTAVMLLVSSASFRATGGRTLVVALRAIADAAAVPVSLQLDHVSQLELMEAGFAAGVDCVMADGSKLGFDENVELVRSACALAADAGGEVEAELGRIEGDEESAVAVDASGATDPGEAVRFVEATGAACLAVAIGNVHGTYRFPPRLDLVRLTEISRAVSVPLALHGASGIPEADLRAAIAAGAAKVNVNTELRQRYLATTAEQLPLVHAGAELLALHQAQLEAVSQVAADKLAICGGGGHP